MSYERTQNIIDLINASGIAPDRVTIEITETAILQNFALADTHIRLFRAIGVQVAFDDFGTGYSSLSYVHALPLDRLKIDRSFIADLCLNRASQNIVRSVISLCQDINLPCVVEGVETAEQLQTIQDLGGTLVQGFFISKPMPASAVPDYLSQNALHRM